MIAMPQGPTTPPERAFFRQLLTTLDPGGVDPEAELKKIALDRLQLARDLGAFEPTLETC